MAALKLLGNSPNIRNEAHFCGHLSHSSGDRCTQIKCGRVACCRASGKPTDLITLDLDYATADFMDRVEMGLVLAVIDYSVHSTRRHEDEKPGCAFSSRLDEIREWIDTPVPLQRLLDEYNYDRFPDPDRGIDPEKVMVERVVVRDRDILQHVLREEGVVKNQQTIQNFDSAMGVINEWRSSKHAVGKERFYAFGIQARWKVRAGATDEEIALGYRVLTDSDLDDLI